MPSMCFIKYIISDAESCEEHDEKTQEMKVEGLPSKKCFCAQVLSKKQKIMYRKLKGLYFSSIVKKVDHLALR